jgi:hypothetical protein
MFQTVTRQTLHYLGRPHSSLPTKPLVGPAAWRGEDLRPEQWTYRLTSQDIGELDAALDRSEHIPLERMEATDLTVPMLATRFARWRHELSSGRGFVVVRGFPVERWEEARASRCFWALGQHLGMPGAQNAGGELLGHVRDEGAEVGTVRAYRTNEGIPYHCDAADVVGLMCLRASSEGGLSRLVSSVSVFNELLHEAPELAKRLFEPFWLDTRGDGAVNAFPVPPCRHHNGALRTFFHSDYFRSATKHASVPAFREVDTKLLETYERIANREALRVDMALEVGDVQFVNNHTVLHARSEYPSAAPGKGRHLLRLWLSLERPNIPVRERWLVRSSHVTNLGRLAGQLVRERLASV